MDFMFVSGSHKSGTSWLARMINAHEKIGLPDQEMWLFGHKDSLATRMGPALDAWLDLPTVRSQFKGQKARSRVRNSALRAAIRGAIAPAIGDLQGKSLIGDKTPAFYALKAARLHQVFPNGYFVHIVRDPRDVIVSHHYHAYRLDEWEFFGDKQKAQSLSPRVRNNEDVGTDLLDPACVKWLADDWRRVQQGGDKARELFGEHFVSVRYEDLLTDGVGNLGRVFDALNEPLPADRLARIVAQFSFREMSRGRESGEQDATSFFRKGMVGDWVNHFDESSLELCRAACGTTAQAWGYDLGSGG